MTSLAPLVTVRNDQEAWWRDAVIYQIYPRSFADSDGDGLGDLPGITSHMDHLAALGVDAIWLSPFYPSPQVDAGYDVADYFDVAPEYGTLADFDEMVAAARAVGIRVVIDLVPNHSSDQHAWFRAALQAGPGSPERERYIFRHSPDGPPNNWGSLFGGPAWTRVEPLTGREEDRDWWYLHLFAAEQPDFNWDHPDVHEMFREFLRFWAGRGVDGFRVDVAHGLVKAPGLPDDALGEDRWRGTAVDDERPKTADNGPMFDQPGVHDIYRDWRSVLGGIRPDILLVAEAWVDPPEQMAKYVREDEMSQAFNFDYLKSPWRAPDLRRVIDTSRAANAAVGAPTTWVLSNHDVVRHATRFGFAPGAEPDDGIGAEDPQPDTALGLRKARAATLFALGLPGSMYMFQGEELGLPEHTTMDDACRQDPAWLRTDKRTRGRDGCRVPLPWAATGPAYGFNTTGRTWLPQPDGWGVYAPAVQESDPDSTLSMYRRAIAARREWQLGRGEVEWVQDLPEQVLAFRNGEVTVAINMGDGEAVLPLTGTVLVQSWSGQTGGRLDAITVPANAAVWLAA
ncbi:MULTISPECIES: alpha-amylase family glycosyl hydrolase [unclassified Actinomyces]|uniref:glycoside hydrolase family 13 protein n=1 Tax=unclassified Actinomyces TaxID=2609248 RepID=UPI000D599422|nr:MULTISPECIES: alpha-amylase family glycosyl hydrolase [unclassified Actinomyces]RAX22423.1 alpha-amylase [Actinomyces sp. Z3]